METIAVVIVLLVVILAPLIGLAWLQRRTRPERREQPAAIDSEPSAGWSEVPTWSEVRAGDQLVWGDAPDLTYAVVAAIDCREERQDRVFGWRWIVLEGDRLLEYRGARLTLFDAPAILAPDSTEFAALVGADGALATFESRARFSWEPVSVLWDGRAYFVSGTGNFYAWSDTDLSERPVWQGLSRDPTENVYFALERSDAPAPADAPEGAAAPEGALAPSGSNGEELILGVWTDLLALYRCQRTAAVGDVQIARPPWAENE